MRATTRLEDGTRTWAVLSDDGAYRYRLGRRWRDDGACDVWIMLNPSTADATVNDRTINRCIGFSRLWGAAGIVVVNLFALRSTDPDQLRLHPDPIGPDNDHHLLDVVGLADQDEARVIAAWGAHPMATERGRIVQRAIAARRDRWTDHGLLSLGATRTGAPRHPLYVRADTEPAHWEPL